MAKVKWNGKIFEATFDNHPSGPEYCFEERYNPEKVEIRDGREMQIACESFVMKLNGDVMIEFDSLDGMNANWKIIGKGEILEP